MDEEADNRHVTNETKQLIEKDLALEWNKMFTPLSDILMQVTSNFGESSTRHHSDKINPFKVKINLDILNLEGNIDAESIDNWVQQLESYYAVNQISEDKKITIASLKISTFVHS